MMKRWTSLFISGFPSIFRAADTALTTVLGKHHALTKLHGRALGTSMGHHQYSTLFFIMIRGVASSQKLCSFKFNIRPKQTEISFY